MRGRPIPDLVAGAWNWGLRRRLVVIWPAPCGSLGARWALVSGLTLNSWASSGHATQRHPGCFSPAPPRAPALGVAAADPAPGEPGSSRSQAARGWPQWSSGRHRNSGSARGLGWVRTTEMAPGSGRRRPAVHDGREIAANGFSLRSPQADFDWPGDRVDSQLRGTAEDSQCRPSAGTRDRPPRGRPTREDPVTPIEWLGSTANWLVRTTADARHTAAASNR